MKKKSEKLIRELKGLRYYQRGYQRALWKTQDRLRIEHAKESDLANNCVHKLCEIETSLDEIFASHIGKAIVNEL